MSFLDNNMDELSELIESHHECSLMCFMETWLHSHLTDTVWVPGLWTFWVDRDVNPSGKKGLRNWNNSMNPDT